MSLKEYKNKRDLKKTPEPEGGNKSKGKKLIFVVQRHKATSLHYDFRLEMDGVLKSWAVPKGPSLNPKDKRLAMMVEDHPIDYATFAGMIPEHHYGAGIVEIWDKGTYEDIAEKDKVKGEKKLLKDLKQGSLKFVLHGKKLKGEFALVKMKGDIKGNAWLLIKHQDEYAINTTYSSENDTAPNSPINKALQEEKNSKVTPNCSKKNTSTPLPSETSSPKRSKIIRPGKKYKTFIQPMLAKTAAKPFSDREWLFEIKWDGYRAIAEIMGKEDIKLYSRNGHSFMEKYKPVADELSNFSVPAVFDGEIVALDNKGEPSFQRLQDYSNDTSELYYYVFDLLFYKGKDLRHTALTERKALLKKILQHGNIVRYCDHVEEKGEEFYKAATKKDLEGIMAKKADSHYISGRRTDNWLKIKNHQTLEAVIGGFTEPRGSRKYFGALILGVYKNKKLQYIGHTGTGFTEKGLKELAEKMEPFIRKTSPFSQNIPVNNRAKWLRPILTCNIKYTEKTKDGILRHPVFQGLRVDKAANQVNWEEQVKQQTSALSKKPRKLPKASKPAMKNPSTKAKIVTINKHRITLTNLDKIFWPKEKITKGDVIIYYETISKLILPYLKNRPESLKRNPNGIADNGFFHKDAGDDAPEWMDTKKIHSASTGENVNYILCNNKATLLYLSNLGCIELNPWNSRIDKLDNPDYFIIDIDPSEKNNYDEVIDVALAVKQVMDKAGGSAYCKTSGATGMHVYVPLGAKYTYDQARSFAELVAHLVNEQLPNITTLERSLQKREKNKIYLDYLQNSRGQTLACAYSLRPKANATVSAPLKWSEVKHGLRPDRFTIHTMPTRIDKVGDLFHEVLKKGIDMNKCIRSLENNHT